MHSLKDAQLVRSKTLPAAGASASTETLELRATTRAAPHVEVEGAVPALPNLAADKSVTITLEDSADASTYAAISGLAALKVTGAVGGGGAAASQRVRLPSAARRYLRATAAVEAAGGNNTAISFTLGLIF